MSNENKEVAKINPLTALTQQIQNAAGVREVILLAEDRFIKNHQLTTGKKDGALRFQSELLNYLDIINEKPELKNADKFSHFAAVMKAATTGLSFKSDGHLYPIAYKQGEKTVVKVTIGAHGKREMLRLMPEIKFLHEGQVVMKGDKFFFDKINSRIKEHETTKDSSVANSLNDVMGAYMRIEWKDNRITDVYLTREEILRAKSKSKNQGDNSVWEQWPLEMSKKVVYHRAKKLYHRYKDGVMDFGGEAPNTAEGDVDTLDTDFSDVTGNQSGSGEAEFHAAEEVKDEPKKPTKPKREVPEF